MPPRHSKPSFRAVELAPSFYIEDAACPAISYVYWRDAPALYAAHLTKDDARRLAAVRSFAG